MKKLLASLAMVLAMVLALVAPAAAQEWPTKPIRMLHGFTPGGNVDITARLVSQVLQEGLGQPVVVEGRPGAGGTVVANVVAKSEPDGYTLFTMASGHSVAPALYKSISHDAANDYTMISLVSSFPFVIAVGSGHAAKTIGELVAMARKDPGKLDLAHAGVGTGMHLAGVLLQSRTSARFNEVPYKGGTAAPLAAAQGEVAAVFDTPAGMEALVRGGRVRPLALTFAQRWPNWPDVPTVAETVSPGFEVRGWIALAAPKGLAKPILDRLVAALHGGLARPEIGERFKQMGTGVTPTAPAETQAFLASEIARWAKLAADEKLPLQD